MLAKYMCSSILPDLQTTFCKNGRDHCSCICERDMFNVTFQNNHMFVHVAYRQSQGSCFEPEPISFAAMQFTFLQDDIGVPLNYRHMEGFGVHTFTLINKEGKITYVKFHWKPTCGVKNLLEDEAIQVGGSNHSHATAVCVLSLYCF